VVGYIHRQFTCLQTVTHPSSNQARHRVTTLIKTNAFAAAAAAITGTYQTQAQYLSASYAADKK